VTVAPRQRYRPTGSVRADARVAHLRMPWSAALAPRVRTPWRPRRHFTGHRLVAVPRGDGLLRAPGPPGEARRWASAAPTV